MTELKTTGVNKVPSEKEFIRKDGTKVPIMVAGAMLDEARFNGVAFVLDITERKRVEEELRKSRDELELRVHERTEALQKAYETLKEEVAERGRAEEALHESEERYRTLFNAIDQGFCIVEVIFDENEKPIDYRFLEINETFEKQTGLIDAQGKRMRELAPKHEEHWFEIYGTIALTGNRRALKIGPSNCTVGMTCTPSVLANRKTGKSPSFLTTSPSGERTEDTLRRQAALLDLSPDAIIVRDMNGTITLWGHGAELLYGWTRSRGPRPGIACAAQDEVPRASGANRPAGSAHRAVVG